MYQLPKPRRHRLERLFQPDYIAESVQTIDFDQLAAEGIKAVYIDLDGTVVPRGKYDVHEHISASLQRQPLTVYIATNRPKSRSLKNLKERLNADGVVHPRGWLGKPFPRYYRQSLAERNVRADEAVMIGDRYIQDIFGANAAGLRTVLVRKIDRPTNWFDHLLSGLERNWTDYLARRYRPVR